MHSRALLCCVILTLTLPSCLLANWTVRLEQTLQQSHQNSGTFRRQGFVPVYAKAYLQNGAWRVDEIWERGNGKVAWDLRVKLTGAEFARLDAKLKGQGYTQYCHAIHPQRSTAFHTGVWRKGRLGPLRAIHIDQDIAANKQTAQRLTNLGYAPVYLRGSAMGQAIRLDQIWEKPARVAFVIKPA